MLVLISHLASPCEPSDCLTWLLQCKFHLYQPFICENSRQSVRRPLRQHTASLTSWFFMTVCPDVSCNRRRLVPRLPFSTITRRGTRGAPFVREFGNPWSQKRWLSFDYSSVCTTGAPDVVLWFTYVTVLRYVLSHLRECMKMVRKSL